ncbi:hypothetical protein [Rhizobium beringeri]|uniref:helix-hairpin-helix domain-containing protein n=1 Tax=Rhizobium beringeri TaxID=3019934 RepID=UPI003B5A9CB1
MGFYAPAQIVTDARAHGVAIPAVCINRSRWDCTLEEIRETDRHAVRLGMRLVRGLPEQDAAKIAVARGDEPFVSIDDMWRAPACRRPPWSSWPKLMRSGLLSNLKDEMHSGRSKPCATNHSLCLLRPPIASGR